MITPMDIHNKQFSRGIRGYNEEEVRDFLQQIVSDYEQIYREHREMEDELDQMKTRLANYERISETMTSALQLAKDTARNVTENARRSADVMIANAKAEGDKQLREARENRRLLNETITRTEGNMKTYIGKIRKDLELALAAVNALDAVAAPLPMEEEPEETPASVTAAPASPEIPETEETPAEEPSAETAPEAEETPAAENAETPAEETEPAQEAAEEEHAEETAEAEEAEKETAETPEQPEEAAEEPQEEEKAPEESTEQSEAEKDTEKEKKE